MARLEGWPQKALLAELIEKLQEKGSWCGETHVQKCAYFLEDLFGVPVGFDFVLYKHGPYSFDLHDALFEMKANGLIDAVPKTPYGVSFRLGERSHLLLSRERRSDVHQASLVAQVAQQFGHLSVAELERLATALFITRRRDAGSEGRAAMLNRLKPHIPLSDARDAVAKVDALLETVAPLPTR